MPSKDCCECGEKFRFSCAPNMAGGRCMLCAQENWVNWLVRTNYTTRDGVPDGHTPAMTPEARSGRHDKIAVETAKLMKLRARFPERAKRYAAKNQKDIYSMPWGGLEKAYA
jgi:hypothetical protein